MKRGHLKFLVLWTAVSIVALGVSWVRGAEQAKQNPPAAPAEEQEYSEEEYNAYEAAVNEPDLDKRSDALIAFMEKFPKSKLQPHIVAAYQTLAYEFRNKKQFDKLLSLSERWMKFFPDDLQTIAYATEATSQVGNNQKHIEYALKIYALKPTAPLAYEIADTYKKLGDEAKNAEWLEKVMAYPEYEGDFKLRLDRVEQFAKQKNLPKAAEWAERTLKSVAAAKKPEGTPDADWHKAIRAVQRNCHWIIGQSHYEAKKYPAAVQELEEALKAEVFDGAFYYIGLSQWKMEQIEEATISFATAELMKGDLEKQSKEHLEDLYKALHNNTLIGIDKVYKKGQARLDAAKAAAK